MNTKLSNADEHQQAQIDKIVDLVTKLAPDLELIPGNSKWSEGNLVFRYPGSDDGVYAFMLGALKNGKTTFHMMPYYGLPDMRAKYDEVFKPFISGKSCINFKNYDDLPLNALEDVVENGTPAFKPIWEEYHKKNQKKK